MRRRLAAERDAPPNVTVDDAPLQQMAYYFPQSRKSLSRISGMRGKKLNEMGAAFIAVIGRYTCRHDLVERSIPVARSGRGQRVLGEATTKPRRTNCSQPEGL